MGGGVYQNLTKADRSESERGGRARECVYRILAPKGATGTASWQTHFEGAKSAQQQARIDKRRRQGGMTGREEAERETAEGRLIYKGECERGEKEEEEEEEEGEGE